MPKRLIFLRLHAATAPQFYCSRCGWEGPWWGSKCPNPNCGA
jgi:hypothetical protein